jgi:hypothetical protein
MHLIFSSVRRVIIVGRRFLRTILMETNTPMANPETTKTNFLSQLIPIPSIFEPETTGFKAINYVKVQRMIQVTYKTVLALMRIENRLLFVFRVQKKTTVDAVY